MTLNVGMLLFPRLTQLDLTGPFEVMHRIPGARVHLVWKDLEPVRADSGLGILPTTRIDDCPPLDVVFVPGGGGTAGLMSDDPVLDFLAAQGKSARYVTSVCTGSLVLGAAGLLEGRRATGHWLYLDPLRAYGAEPEVGRWIEDGKIITAAGVSAGIDMALHLVDRELGPEVAQAIQLGIEYDPQPPFDSGAPHKAPAPIVEAVRAAAGG
jgi:cyclohexyl-isocyanide hydratase